MALVNILCTIPAVYLAPTRVETDVLAEQGSISFLKKETKTFTFLAYATNASGAYSMGKKFFGSFFQKRTVFLRLPSSRDALLSMRLVISLQVQTVIRMPRLVQNCCNVALTGHRASWAIVWRSDWPTRDINGLVSTAPVCSEA
jgi:hypothetical protein